MDDPEHLPTGVYWLEKGLTLTMYGILALSGPLIGISFYFVATKNQMAKYIGIGGMIVYSGLVLCMVVFYLMLMCLKK